MSSKNSKIVLNHTASSPTLRASFENITRNLSSKYTRNAQLEGREFIVCPMVMGVEGVLAGNNGPGLYLGEDWQKFSTAWDHKPIVVYHPEIAGKGVTACSPTVMNMQKIGLVLNTRWDSKASKLRAEAWIDRTRVEEVDKRVLEAIQTNSMMEVSTGLFCDQEISQGLHKGKKYEWIARNHRPDHLAVLPDQIGAASIADGAGLLQLNSSLSESEVRVMLAKAHSLLINRSFGQITSDLNDLIKKSVSVDSFISDVYSSTVVYYFAGNYYAVDYAVVDDVVSLVGSPQLVKEGSRTFVKTDGSVISNSTQGNKTMAKKELIDSLIAQGKFIETDRTFLDGLPEDRIVAFSSMGTTAAAPQNPAPAPAPAPIQVPGPVPVPAPAKAATIDEYLAMAPLEFRDVLSAGLQMQNAQKQQMVATILACNSNTFPAERLNSMAFADLQALAALASQASKPTPTTLNYLGQGFTAQTPVTNSSKPPIEVLTVPTIDWSKK
jgi:hypothetical protein